MTGGTATNGGVDYTLTDGTLTFAPGETTKALSGSIVDDAQFDANETVVITLFNSQSAVQMDFFFICLAPIYIYVWHRQASIGCELHIIYGEDMPV